MKSNAMQGLVVKTTGNDVWVRLSDGRIVACRVRGQFRLKEIKSTTPVVVGDMVEVDLNNQISRILERKNYIARRPTNLSKQIHIIATNIDIAVLVVSLKKPETSLVFIDRFIASAEAYGVEVILIFNKIDILNNEEKKHLDNVISAYQKIGYACIKLVATTKMGLPELFEKIKGKIVLLSGNSGVGKSTIINALAEKEVAKVGEISHYHKKGMHTTTFSEMFVCREDTLIIDTPGIKGFGVVDMSSDEISHYFREIFKYSKGCRFFNCSHTHEPDCEVLNAIQRGDIEEWRYISYISMMEEALSNDKYR